MYSLSNLTEIVEKGIVNLSIPKEPARLYEPITYTLSSGGKRIRPVLLLAACNTFSDSIDLAINPALALELFHNFTLIHDDIMDDAPIRRNRPTVFSKWGADVAILSGDALNILAYQLLSKTHPDYLPQVLKVFNSVALDVCDGQQMDMDFETSPFVTQEEYLKMIELKTSALLKGAAQIGAIMGGASQGSVSAMGDFAYNLGMAFQLQDDLFDAYANENVFGKKIGGDIVANKKTFLTIKAFSLAKGASLELLTSYFKSENVDEEKKIEGVLNIYDETGVEQLTRNLIEEYNEKAMSALERIDVHPERKDVIECLARKIMDRDK